MVGAVLGGPFVGLFQVLIRQPVDYVIIGFLIG